MCLGNGVQRWKPREEGYVKVNVDAFEFEGSNSFSIDMVLRNYKGTFIAGKNLRLSKSNSVFESEAMGVYEMLSWIETKAIHQAVIE